MFVDLMSDIYNTFSDRFLKVQLQFGPPPDIESFAPNGRDPTDRRKGTGRFDALGVREDVPATAPEQTNFDIGPDEPPKPGVAMRKDPLVIGAGRTKSLSTGALPAADVDWASVGRNDPCPCGSGKKFKKCHGATV